MLRPLLLAACLAFAAAAHAQAPPQGTATSCVAPFKVGYRVIRVGKLTAALWYPTMARERSETYADGTRSDVARGAPPLVTCGGFPLVVFSHGLGGCGIQSVFFTEALARHGYVVVAPDHADASFCSTDGSRPAAPQTTPPPLLDPGAWSSSSYADRRADVRIVLDAMLRDGAFRDAIAPDRIGIAGHSLGGYVALAMAGAWKDWHDPRLRAALVLSPYSLPLSLRGDLRSVRVPLMYQGAELDLFVTPFIEGPQGAYAAANPPKYFAKLRGGHHFTWTNLQCVGMASVAGCGRERPEARLINGYGIAFFEQHLKGRVQPLLGRPNPELSAYLRDP